MSAISSSSQCAPVAAGSGPVSAAEIDASCRPVLLYFFGAAAWLLVGAVFGLIASLKFHQPALLAGCPCFSYGRVHPVQWNALIYGFGIQAGLGVMLWLIARLGGALLTAVPAAIAGFIFLNLGMVAGIGGILAGDNTGFEMLEMPRYAAVLVFFGYIFAGVSAARTWRDRAEQQLYISQWFLLAALFWFPWIYSTANLLLVGKPVRGALQSALAGWYAKNLVEVWFGFVGLAAMFYFIPKITRRPLYSHYLGIFVFCTLATFGSWGGVAAGSPLPSWLAALSTSAEVLAIIPAIAVAINVRQTFGGDYSALGASAPLRFIYFGALAYIIASLAGVIASVDAVSEIVNFTWFVPAELSLRVFGFFAMTMFGAIYYIAPKLTGLEFCSAKAVAWHFRVAMAGILFYALPLAIGGVFQGLALNNANIPFVQVMHNTLNFFRISTLGDVCMIIASLILLLNLFGMKVRFARACATTLLSGGVKPAEVTT